MSIFLKLGHVPWQTHRTNPFFPTANSVSSINRYINIYRYDTRRSARDQRRFDTEVRHGGSTRRFDMEVRHGSFPNGVSGGARKKQGSEEEAEVGRPLRFLPVAEEDLQAAAEFVPDGSERIEAGFLRAGDPRRVGESPVDPVRLPEEDGADLLGAEADHGVDGPRGGGIQPL